jgi:aspartyl-tRNA(Asn)/glutamyl-tRNA(Gln) amidotransferase subunit B
VAEFVNFDRKHYFYPDLPMGFQITQSRNPVAVNGSVRLSEVDGLTYERIVGISQIQLEMDSGKILKQGDDLLVDLNRAGVGVLEIVTSPDLRCLYITNST